MAARIEREIKLRFPNAAEARAAVLAAGATPLRDRRLQNDCLLDTADDDAARPAIGTARPHGIGQEPAHLQGSAAARRR